MTFEQEIWIIAFDKGLIGLLLILGGFILNRVLEKYRSKQSLHNELAKIRISKTGECWETVFKSDSLAKELINIASEGFRRYGNDNWTEYVEYLKNNTSQLEPKIYKEILSSRVIIEKNRFWIGDNSYSNFQSYISSINHYIDSYTVGDSNNLKEAERDLIKRRKSVVDLFNEINDEK